jgi:serine/threonine protein kinase
MKLADLSSGVTIANRFRLVDILGRGSYGDVWLAEVLRDGWPEDSDDGGGGNGVEIPDKVALKIYQQQERARQKLLEEARMAVGLTHDRLVRVYGADSLDGIVMMWMDYVPGKTLLQRIGDDASPKTVFIKEVLSWIHDMAEALAYLHAIDPPLVHGDLKLDNVILNSDDKAQLVDFGQSRYIEDCFVETSGAGAWPYLSPEILGTNTKGYGKRYVSSDIYAFGVIVYRLITGRFPRRTPSEVINLSPFPRPIEINASVPPELDQLVIKCLEKRPENRFQTGAALLAAIIKLQENLNREEKDTVPIAVDTVTTTPTPSDELADLAMNLLNNGKVEEVLRRLEKAMQRMSTSPRILLVYAEAAKHAGRFDLSRAVYEKAWLWMKHNGCSDEELRSASEGLSELNIKLKKYDEAAKGYEWLAKNWPDNRWYSYRYGVALGISGNYQRSIDILQKLYESGKPSSLICAKIGLAYAQLNDPVQACAYFNEALMLDQFEPTALFHLARIRAIQGNTAKAFECLERLRDVEGADDQANELARYLGRIN